MKTILHPQQPNESRKEIAMRDNSSKRIFLNVSKDFESATKYVIFSDFSLELKAEFIRVLARSSNHADGSDWSKERKEIVRLAMNISRDMTRLVLLDRRTPKRKKA